ncbi:MAG: O-antigen ligase family protein [Bacillota bacterium]
MVAKAQVKTRTVSVMQGAPLPLSHSIAFWGIAGLLFFTPFFRGLFFPPEQERALVVGAVAFLLVYLGRWLRWNSRFFIHPLDFLIAGFPLIYVLSSFVAVNKGLAVNEIVKASLYFTVFWAVSRLVTGEEVIRRISCVIWGSGVLVALAGLATATEIIFIRDGFLGGRIYSSFQYPNALANYLLCVLILGVYLWVTALGRGAGIKEVWTSRPAWVDRLNPVSYLFAAGNFLLAAVFWGAKSNGGILTLILIGPLLLLGVPKEKRLPLFLHALQVGLPGLLVALVFINQAIGKKYDIAWLTVFGGLVAAVGLQVAYDLAVKGRWVRKIKLSPLALCAGGTLLAAGAGVAFALHPGLLQRFLALIHFRNAVERLYFYRDAIEMILARPLMGWGGGGWQEAYRAYQDYLYNSTQVHGYYFQVGVETGLIGLALIVGIWLAFLHTSHRLYHGAGRDDGRRLLVWVMTVAALSIGIHSAIDFNLSLSALALVLFAIFGIVVGLALPGEDEKVDKKRRKVKEPRNVTPLAVVVIAVLIMVAGGFSLARANSYAVSAEAALRSGNGSNAVKMFERAKAFDPFSAEYDAMLGRIYLNPQMGNPEKSVKAAEAAVAKSRYSALRRAELASAYHMAGRYEDALKAAKEAVALAPFQVQWYEHLARLAFNAGYLEVNADHKDQARPYFEQVVKVPDLIKARMEKVTPQERRLWVVAPLMEPTPPIEISVGASLYFLGRFTEAAPVLEKALKELEKDGISEQEKEMYAECCLWLALVSEKQGDAASKQKYLDKGKSAVPGIAEWFEHSAKLPVLK